jgi:hypothetical protein
VYLNFPSSIPTKELRLSVRRSPAPVPIDSAMKARLRAKKDIQALESRGFLVEKAVVIDCVKRWRRRPYHGLKFPRNF